MKISYARLHKPSHVPGLGTVKEGIDNKAFPGLDITLEGGLVTVVANRDPLRAKATTFVMPVTNFDVLLPIIETK